jgi:hypothetical protein
MNTKSYQGTMVWLVACFSALGIPIYLDISYADFFTANFGYSLSAAIVAAAVTLGGDKASPIAFSKIANGTIYMAPVLVFALVYLRPDFMSATALFPLMQAGWNSVMYTGMIFEAVQAVIQIKDVCTEANLAKRNFAHAWVH